MAISALAEAGKQSYPGEFLTRSLPAGEKVVVFDVFESQGQHVWIHKLPPFNACELDDFRTGKRNGVWFLCQPVTGDYFPNHSGSMSRRSWQNVTSWRYLVLESDKANPAHWLAALAQMPLAISAIYTSGGQSIHALVRLDAESKHEWDAAVAQIKPILVTLGADPKAMSAVRLTRLQCANGWAAQTPTGSIWPTECLASSGCSTSIRDQRSLRFASTVKYEPAFE